MIERHIENKILEALKNFRIIFIDGARQTGKTTFVKHISKKNRFNYISFDDINKREFAKNNWDGFIQLNPTPLIIDEVQKVPEIIEKIKISVDENNSPGQFILTGSIDIFKTKKIEESLAGRMVKYEMYPFSIAEINKYDFNLIDALFAVDIKKINNLIPRDETKVIGRLLSGCFPEIYNKQKNIIHDWFKSYINARIKIDIKDDIEKNLRRSEKIPNLLRLLANQTSNLLKYDTIAQKLAISPNTAKDYIFLIESIFFIKRLKPFFKNQGKALKKMQKLYFIDTGIVSYLSKINEQKLLVNRQLFGQLLENYLYLELIKQISTSKFNYDLFYFRDDKTNEVDFVIENEQENLIAIEIKSATNINEKELKGLRSFYNKYKDKIIAMYVIYGGKEISSIKINDSSALLLPYRFFF